MSRKQARRIVVGVDFDLCGDEAIAHALQLVADGWASEIHAVYVLDPAEVIDNPEMPALFTEERVLGEAPSVVRDRVQDVARAVGVPLTASGLRLHARIGKPASALVQVA